MIVPSQIERIIVACFLLACCPPAAQNSPDIRVDVDLVTIAAFVADSSGAPAKNLRREDFTLLDNGRPREIQYLWQEDAPLTIGFVADVSGSQRGEVGKHQDSITKFVSRILRPDDQAFIVTVDADARVVADLTNSVDKLREGIEAIKFGLSSGPRLGESCRAPEGEQFPRRPFCNSAIWDGIYYIAKLKMKSLPGRKAMILLSDGLDEGSRHSVNDAIEAARSADTILYAIGRQGILAKIGDAHGMQRIVSETGGKMVRASAEPFAEMENELRNLYILGLVPPEDARDGKFHKVEVKVNRRGATVRARKGYTASGGIPK